MNLKEIIHYLKCYDGPDIKLMEVCGTHTSTIVKHGIRGLLSPKIKLVSGPGCPVCVTPEEYIHSAVDMALRPGYKLLTFGDLLKVPGKKHSLSQAKAEGASVEIIYSPMEVPQKALSEPGTIYVLAAVGFETTIPLYGLLLESLEEKGIYNVRLLTSLKSIVPALVWLCGNEADICGFIAPGHTSAITGSNVYEPLAAQYKKPFVVAGFEPEHVLAAIYDLMCQINANRWEVHNLYRNVVKPEGNVQAQSMMERFFEPSSALWRGIGNIDRSGYTITRAYVRYMADMGDDENFISDKESPCKCGEIMRGRMQPRDCTAYGKHCLPSNPLGPCMVTHEGACGIQYSEDVNIRI